MEMAVIKTGGKQYVVSAGSIITVEKLGEDTKAGDKVVFDQVLLTDDGSATKVGAPLVSGAKVTGTVKIAGKGPKVSVVRYKAKSRYLKRRGHRQTTARVRIDSIA